MHADQTPPVRPDNDRDVFLILSGLYLLILYPILRADRYYNDDLKRALIGHQSWDAAGRPLTTLLMRLLQCYGRAMVDISPLTQLGAVAALAWIGVLIARRYAIGSSWMAALAAFPLGAQPFFLENLSYKFDALSMSLAVLFALLPILTQDGSRRRWWLGVLSLFASLSFYQAAITTYLVFIVLDFVLGQLDARTPRQLVIRAGLQVMQVATAMLGYQVIIGIHIHGWVKRNSEPLHGVRQWPMIGSHFVDFYRYIGSNFSEQWKLYFIPLLISLLLLPVSIGVRYAIESRPAQSRWACAALLLLGLLMPLALLACVPGPMLILLKPLFLPRELIGFGALWSSLLILLQAALRQWRVPDRWGLAIAWMPALGMCVIASAYGNALGEQKIYENQIATHLADDLAELKAGRAIDAFLPQGSAGHSPVTAHVIDQFPLVDQLIPVYLNAGDLFHLHLFLRYYISGIENMQLDDSQANMQSISKIQAQICQTPISHTTSAYELRLIDRVAVVTFRAGEAPSCSPVPHG